MPVNFFGPLDSGASAVLRHSPGHSRRVVIVALVASSLWLGGCSAATPRELPDRPPTAHASPCRGATKWSAARQSLERDLAGGFVTPSTSLDGGRLDATVAGYMQARLAKDVDALIGFLETPDASIRESQQAFYKRTLPREAIHSYRVLAARPLENHPATIQVFTVVVIEVGGRCYEDVLTTLWQKFAVGWKEVPVNEVEPV